MAYHTMVHLHKDWGKKKDWATPQYFYDELNERFDFGLDSAASLENHKNDNWFGLDHPEQERRNALSLNWMDFTNKSIWCNPPYGKEIRDFLNKGIQCAVPVVYLLPNSTDTRWFHDIAKHHTIEFVKGRLKFGNSKSPASFGSMLVIMNG